MKLETFFKHFDLLAEAPNGVQKLRELILDLAVRGKLTVNWRKENANIEPVIKTIQYFSTLQHNRKTRRGVPDNVPASVVVKGWLLPSTWVCISAAELLNLGIFIDIKDGNHGGNHPKTNEFTKIGIPFITAAQVNQLKIDYQGAYKLSGEALEKIKVGFAQEGDVIYTHKGSIGRVAINEQKCILSPQTTYYRIESGIILNKYLMWYLLSYQFRCQVNEVKTQTTRDFVSITQQYKFFHIIPPLEEQHQIVTKVDELMKLCDELEARQKKKQETRILINNAALNKLLTADTPETFTKNWQRIGDNFDLLYSAPENIGKLRQAILQLAVMGKLVPQDANDEPAAVLLERIKIEKERLVKEGKIKKARTTIKINNTEIPYKIPKNWIWVHLADVGHDWGQKKPDIEFTYIDVSAINKEKGIISNDVNILQPNEAPSRARKIVYKGTLIYSTVRPYLLNIAIIDKEFKPEPIVSTAFAVIHPFSIIIAQYLYFYLRSNPFIEYVESQMKGMAYPAINDGQLYQGLVPLPPLAEQKRIVTKVDKLMKLCDELETKLTQTQTEREKIINAAVKQLLTV